MDPSFVVVDLDGTCIGWNGELNQRIPAAITECAKVGVPVILATGRMYVSAAYWAQQLNITAPIICYQGAVVREMPVPEHAAALHARGGIVAQGAPGRLLHETLLSPNAGATALEVLRKEGWARISFMDEMSVVEEERDENSLYQRIPTSGPRLVASLDMAVERGCPKLVAIITDPKDLARCLELLKEKLGSTATVQQTTRSYVEVASPEASKSNALRFLCGHLGLALKSGIAIGDGPNDLDMLQAAGWGVAIESEWPDVMKAAHEVAASPGNGGVADILEKYVLHRATV